MEWTQPLLPDKEFFNMGEACRLTQLPPHTLRYWESRTRLLKPVRLVSGHRRYRREDLETLFQLKELLRDRSMTLAGARRAMLRQARGGLAARAAAGRPDATMKILRELRADLRGILSELS